MRRTRVIDLTHLADRFTVYRDHLQTDQLMIKNFAFFQRRGSCDRNTQVPLRQPFDRVPVIETGELDQYAALEGPHTFDGERTERFGSRLITLIHFHFAARLEDLLHTVCERPHEDFALRSVRPRDMTNDQMIGLSALIRHRDLLRRAFSRGFALLARRSLLRAAADFGSLETGRLHFPQQHTAIATFARLTDQRRSRVRQLHALLQPAVDFLEIYAQLRRLRAWIVEAYSVQVFTTAGIRGARHDDAIAWLVFPTDTTETNLDRHCCSPTRMVGTLRAFPGSCSSPLGSHAPKCLTFSLSLSFSLSSVNENET